MHYLSKQKNIAGISFLLWLICALSNTTGSSAKRYIKYAYIIYL